MKNNYKKNYYKNYYKKNTYNKLRDAVIYIRSWACLVNYFCKDYFTHAKTPSR